MSCPFMNKFSTKYTKKYGDLLIRIYGSHCPVFSRYLSEMSKNEKDAEQEYLQLIAKCPFLKNISSDNINVKIIKKLKHNEDIIEISNETEIFSYDHFFREQVLKKKLEHAYRIFKRINRLADSFPKAVEITSKTKNTVTVWCSNDYLGMSRHPEVKKEAQKALEHFGTSAGGTRNISGNNCLHEDLEMALAKLHNKEAALLFSSCFVANDTSLLTLAKMLPDCHLFSDERNHASMIQGIKNSRVSKHIFKHNNVEHLEELLQKFDKKTPKIVAFETVNSMTGEVCPMEEMCDVAHKHGAIVFVDEVHAVGLYGRNGAGIGERDGLLDKMDVISGTLGKAFGNVGGYIAGKKSLVDTIRSYGAGFIFTTSLPPATVAGAKKAVEILRSDEGRCLRKQHQKNVAYLREKLCRIGFPVRNTASHILPIVVGNAEKCTLLSNMLLQEKYHYIQAINHPTVARGEELLRLAPTPHHTKEMMDLLVNDLLEVWVILGLSLSRSYVSSDVCIV